MSHSAPVTPPVPGQKGYWRYLHGQMLAALGDAAFLRFNGYTVPGRTFQYRSADEFRKLLEWVKQQADVEDGTPSFRGRTYAGQRGQRGHRGRE